jgi:serine/threonine-protein kinase RsbW
LSRFRITIDSDLGMLFVVSILMRGVCDHLGLNADDAASLELCAVEAATNAIKHAYRGAPGHEVSLEVFFTRDRLYVDVCDQGASMPEEQIGKLRTGSHVLEFDPEDLGAVPEGGMGLEIIRQAMDEASYSSNGGTNCIRLTKFLRPTGSEEKRA